MNLITTNQTHPPPTKSKLDNLVCSSTPMLFPCCLDPFSDNTTFSHLAKSQILHPSISTSILAKNCYMTKYTMFDYFSETDDEISWINLEETAMFLPLTCLIRPHNLAVVLCVKHNKIHQTLIQPLVWLSSHYIFRQNCQQVDFLNWIYKLKISLLLNQIADS